MSRCSSEINQLVRLNSINSILGKNRLLGHINQEDM